MRMDTIKYPWTASCFDLHVWDVLTAGVFDRSWPQPSDPTKISISSQNKIRITNTRPVFVQIVALHLQGPLDAYMMMIHLIIVCSWVYLEHQFDKSLKGQFTPKWKTTYFSLTGFHLDCSSVSCSILEIPAFDVCFFSNVMELDDTSLVLLQASKNTF